MDIRDRVDFLSKVELFASLPAESLLAIAEELKELPVHTNQIVFRQHDFATGLYLVAEGAVEISDEDKVLCEIKAYEFFGELALLDNTLRSRTATAKRDGVLLYLDKIDFDKVTDDLPSVLRAVVGVTMRYLRQYI